MAVSAYPSSDGRVDAGKSGGQEGHYRFEIEVLPGEPLEILRNIDAFAYLVIEGAGLAAVDVNHFYGEIPEDANGDGVPDFEEPNTQSEVLRYLTELDLPMEGVLCDPEGTDVALIRSIWRS